MPQREDLNALFKLLAEMTRSARASTLPASPRMRTLQRLLLIACVATFASLAFIAVGYRLASGKVAHGIPAPVAVLYVVSVFLGVVYIAVIVIDSLRTLWQVRRERFHAILGPLERDLAADADFLTRLHAFDKPTLEYGLVQYRCHCQGSDGRAAILAGDIRKVGLFPALMVAAVSAATLIKDGNSLFLWVPLVLACCFYLMTFAVVGLHERAGQVVALLEYAVKYADEPEKTSRPAIDGHDKPRRPMRLPATSLCAPARGQQRRHERA